MGNKEFMIETERLMIRPLEKNDYEQWFLGFSQRYPSLHHHDDGRPSNLEASNKAWFEDWVTGFELAQLEDRFYQLGVFRKSDGAHVGKIEVYTILRMDYDWGMLGYSIHNQHWRKGYGSEAVQAALLLCKQQLNYHRIELHILPDNTPSIKLAEKVGFKHECTRRQFSKEYDAWHDYEIYYQNL
ncbi:GNAT family N-acetyltransferase [Alkalihalobacillus pseudalcaliphilus]|uniref:GNAT family N-acetyltransferase n=1 Tax=Alkalihalobacillus pseudalcaliphilus TaxID=79884 RepID=UPI00064DA1DB|nr:GNAT family N-acetyltransferase [Alkalihalobacillus pseudalcaliphilus]KMK75861.1 GNAT family acetyltransferase [Alkalihalobacillus pseudalcaliphilus]